MTTQWGIRKWARYEISQNDRNRCGIVSVRAKQILKHLHRTLDANHCMLTAVL
jgi:hypothetical protein